MCGRMTLTRSAEEIARHFGLEASRAPTAPDGSPFRPRFNIAPSQPVLTLVAGESGLRELVWKSWGLVPAWSKDPAIAARLFNARGETVDVKPSFRSAFKRRRCLVVADGFYEWTPRNQGHRAHWLHASGSAALLSFAGLHEQWSAEDGGVRATCTVITTEASADLAGIHHRMPVVLPPEATDVWLDPESALARLKALLAPAPAGTLRARPVSRHVNDPRHDDPDCLAPVAADGRPARPVDALLFGDDREA